MYTAVGPKLELYFLKKKNSEEESEPKESEPLEWNLSSVVGIPGNSYYRYKLFTKFSYGVGNLH
eukprot:SAG31_NODE_27737_length_421_cov_0.639752_1_plen_63_part_10